MVKLLVLILAAFVCLSGCSAPDEADRARAAVQEMLELARAGQWEMYIEQYYGEQDKMQDPGDLTRLADRFRSSWGERIIPVLQEAAGITPVIEDGRAHFKQDGRDVYVLYKSSSGKWTFHL